MINQARLLDTFLALVRIDSPSGEEAAVAQQLKGDLIQLGMSVELDAMHNLVAHLPGKGESLLLAAHMDTVTPGRGVKPVLRHGVVYSDGTTILGADDKSGIAVILEVLHILQEQGLPHPPLEVLITVQEEVGLLGAKGLDKSQLHSTMGISFDAGDGPGAIVVSAPSHDTLSAVVHGRASHAGTQPEKGVSAIVVAAQAILDMPLGRIDEETTANIGTIRGGAATNIIPDRVELRGEARSRQMTKLEAQTSKMVEALQSAARRYGASVDVEVQREYESYNLTESDPMVSRLMAACQAVGVEPVLVPTGGGSDANILNAAGMHVVNLSTGMAAEHSTAEHIAVAEMVTCAEIVLQCIDSLAS